MTAPFTSAAAPAAAKAAVSSPVRSNAPTLAEAMSALHPMEEETTPWHVRERWLVVLLASFLPLTVGLVMQGTPRLMLMVTSGALIAIGLVLLIAHEMRGKAT